MAEIGETNFLPGIPKHAYKFLFTKDFFGGSILQNSFNNVSEKDLLPFCEYVYNVFNKIIQSVAKFLEEISEKNNYVFRTPQDANDICSDDYVKLAVDMAYKFAPNAKYFDAKNFFIYCVIMSRLATNFYDRGILDAPELAKTHILNILQKYDMTTSRWKTLHRIAGMYENMLRVNEQKLEIDSDEIAPSNKTSKND